MVRERRNAPPAGGDRRRRAGSEATERIRRRLRADPDVELTEEELRALIDEGLDPEEVRRAARDVREQPEASIHDRDTPRDQVESLLLDDEGTE